MLSLRVLDAEGKQIGQYFSKFRSAGSCPESRTGFGRDCTHNGKTAGRKNSRLQKISLSGRKEEAEEKK